MNIGQLLTGGSKMQTFASYLLMQNLADILICILLHKEGPMDTLPIVTPRQAGIYVRRARERQGLTRAQLAEAAGVSERLLASLELGDATGIRLDKLLAVFCALGIELAAQGEDIGRNITASDEKRDRSTRSTLDDFSPIRVRNQTRAVKRRPRTDTSKTPCDYDSVFSDFLRNQGIDAMATNFVSRR